MIPVLGVPILNRPDLLYRMLKSIDVQVGRLVIVDNGGVVDERAVRSALNGSIHEICIINPGNNLGVSSSWNLTIKANPKAPWWFICNNDIEFAAGDLQRMVDHMATTQNTFVMLNWMAAFGVTKHVLREVGWFDENFVPAYYEDNDFLWRCKLANVEVVTLPADYRHDGSMTIKSNPLFTTRNMKSFPSNGEYYRAKWGGYPGNEQYETPFSGPGNHREWSLIADRLIDLSW